MSAPMGDMSREEAARRWRQALMQSGWFGTCAVEETDVAAAMGRVTAQPVFALRPVPHYVGSAMDGFAVRSIDTGDAMPERLAVLRIGPPGKALAPGTAAVVNTGDVLPVGADSVIMKENAAVRDGNIEVRLPVLQGQHIRKIGEDIMAGVKVLPANHVIRPADIAAALAAGADRVRIMARPRITVIPSGDEIVDSGEALPPGTIRDINSHMLSALFSSWGATVRRHPVVPDDPDQLREAVATSLAQSDLVVTNAGTSAGTEDFTAEVLASLGQVCCHGVAIRPGHPVLLAVVGGKPVIGLPGYPVSCMLTAELFLHDLLYEYQRRKPPLRRTAQARLDQEIHSRLGVEEFVRVALTPGTPYATAVALGRGASLISTLTQADGYLRIPGNIDKMAAGDIVEVELFSE